MSDLLGIATGHWWCVLYPAVCCSPPLAWLLRLVPAAATPKAETQIGVSFPPRYRLFIANRYFWTEIWTRERASGGRNWLETPRFLCVFSSPPEFPIPGTTPNRAQLSDCLVESTVSSCWTLRADSRNSKRRTRPAQLSRANSNWIGCATTTQQLPRPLPIGRDDSGGQYLQRSCHDCPHLYKGSRRPLSPRFFIRLTAQAANSGALSDQLLFACSPTILLSLASDCAGRRVRVQYAGARHVIELPADHPWPTV